MKNLSKKILIILFLASNINAANTNKTFISPRSVGVNLPMESTTYFELIMGKGEENFGGNIQIVPFYQQSTKKTSVGKYFGVKNKNEFTIDCGATDVDFDYIIHNQGTVPGYTFDLKYTPKQLNVGVRIDYYQDLEKILNGLYLKVALPIANVSNNMQMKISDELVITSADISNYFKGSFTGLDAEANKMAALDHSKIDGSKSTSCVSDLDIIIGYNILKKHKRHFGVNVGLTIPVGDKPNGIYVFEPIVGNNNHWGLGIGIDGNTKFWERRNKNFKLGLTANYRYLFKSSETRTLGLKDSSYNAINFGQYYLIQKNGAEAGTALIPASNVLTRSLDVTPKSQLDAILSLAFNNGGFSIEAGYNFYWKDTEKVKIKTWSASLYGVVAKTFDGYNSEFDLDTVDSVFTIQQANLNVEAATSPSQISNKLYGGLGYIFKEWQYPVMLGLGGSYEWISSNDGLEGWAIWIKAGIAF